MALPESFSRQFVNRLLTIDAIPLTPDAECNTVDGTRLRLVHHDRGATARHGDTSWRAAAEQPHDELPHRELVEPRTTRLRAPYLSPSSFDKLRMRAQKTQARYGRAL